MVCNISMTGQYRRREHNTRKYHKYLNSCRRQHLKITVCKHYLFDSVWDGEEYYGNPYNYVDKTKSKSSKIKTTKLDRDRILKMKNYTTTLPN